jgi:hypothetical protein
MTAERVKELREWLTGNLYDRVANLSLTKYEADIVADLLSVLDEVERLRAESNGENWRGIAVIAKLRAENEALKAENERLYQHHADSKGQLKTLLRLRAENAEYRATNEKYWLLLQKAEAELALARPLLEAVMGEETDILKRAMSCLIYGGFDHDILSAALAYRQAKGAK